MLVFPKQEISARLVENANGEFKTIQFKLPTGKVQNIPLKDYETGAFLDTDYEHITCICDTELGGFTYICEIKETGQKEYLNLDIFDCDSDRYAF